MPDWLIAGLRGGWITGFAVAILLVETGVLLAMRRRLALDAGPLVFNAVSGIALMAALGVALSKPDGLAPIVLCLGISFAAHVADVVSRVRGV